MTTLPTLTLTLSLPLIRPNPSINVVDSKPSGPCNSWMITGSCALGARCRYSHEGKGGVIDPIFHKPCKNTPHCTRPYCPFQHYPGQFKGSGKGGEAPVEQVGSAPNVPNPLSQVEGCHSPEGLGCEGLGCSPTLPHRPTHSSPSKSTNRRDRNGEGAVAGVGRRGARAEVFNTNIINDDPGDEDDISFYNNDDDYDTVMNVIKLVMDSAATDDVMSKNDDNAIKESIDDDIKVDTAGGLVTIRELLG